MKTGQITNSLMDRMVIKKAIGEGLKIESIILIYGHIRTVKVLKQVVNSMDTTDAFYNKCIKVLIELEPTSREEYPELWI